LGPIADRTNVTPSSAPSNSGRWLLRIERDELGGREIASQPVEHEAQMLGALNACEAAVPVRSHCA